MFVSLFTKIASKKEIDSHLYKELIDKIIVKKLDMADNYEGNIKSTIIDDLLNLTSLNFKFVIDLFIQFTMKNTGFIGIIYKNKYLLTY